MNNFNAFGVSWSLTAWEKKHQEELRIKYSNIELAITCYTIFVEFELIPKSIGKKIPLTIAFFPGSQSCRNLRKRAESLNMKVFSPYFRVDDYLKWVNTHNRLDHFIFDNPIQDWAMSEMGDILIATSKFEPQTGLEPVVYHC